MAKRKTASKPPKPSPQDAVLIEVAEGLLSSYFFDPDKEDEYKERLSENKPAAGSGLLLIEDVVDLPEGDATLRIEALHAWTAFRVSVTYNEFTMVVEGLWSFEQEILRQAKVIHRAGSREDAEAAIDDLFDLLEGPDLDDEEMADLMEAVEDDSEAPSIGDDPTEPPEATAEDRARLKAVAKRVSRMADPEFSEDDRHWMEQTPQLLPVLVEEIVALMKAGKTGRDDELIAIWLEMLATQLEFVRYRMDRGWEWAISMLDDYQQSLIELGESGTVPREDWFMMASALTRARVPVSDEVQTALADAGFRDEDAGPPEEMLKTLRGFLDELAGMMSSPFDVIETLKGSSAMMPATLRGFMATELALSPHPQLRETVPLMLLDEDSAVRRDAARALEQTATPDSMSSDSLRRIITVRNWIPVADRPAVDQVVKKARLAGVEIGTWPAVASEIDYHATMIDGSGAQSILAIRRAGKKAMFGGLLLRHSNGLADAWVDIDLTRTKVAAMLKDAKLSAVFSRVGKAYVDTMIQHAIAIGLENDAVPPQLLLQVAEESGGTSWKEERIDPQAEVERLFDTLPAKDRTAEGVAARHLAGLEWMTNDPIIGSWFEEGPEVSRLLKKHKRNDVPGMIAAVMSDILPDRRELWAERFLLMALWAEASSEAQYRNRTADLTVVAKALMDGNPLGEIPVMGVIALQTLRAFREGGW